MSYQTELRNALAQSKDAKESSRNAGEGVWANYVRSTCYENPPRNVEELDKAHKALVDNLNDMRELSKEEKNSLRSAKSVVGKAITNNVGVWQRDDDGFHVYDEQGRPMPKGKSELSEAKTDFDRMVSFVEQAQKKYDSDTREVFTREQMESLANMYAALAHRMVEDFQSVQ